CERGRGEAWGLTFPGRGRGKGRSAPFAPPLMSIVRPHRALAMKTTTIGYCATTTLIALETLAGGVTDLTHGRTMLVSGPPVVEVMTQLGYPIYLLAILGVWKLLGGITLLVP